VLTAVTLTGNS